MLNLPRNVWILTFVTALSSTAAPFFILVGGLMGVQLAPATEWATLPIACVVLGSSTMMVPSIFVLKRLGRKYGSLLGIGLLITSSLICSLASFNKSFFLLLLGSLILGAGTAFLQQFRFAAIESLNDKSQISSALSLLLLGSAAAALLGPEVATFGRIFSTNGDSYTGSFLILALINILAIFVFSQFKNPENPVDSVETSKRPLLTIIRQPIFITAAAAAAVGFGVMSFLMTSTPVSMNHFHGHSVENAKWVIQSHMLAMFLPSLFTGALIQRFGAGVLILSGTTLFSVVLIIAFMGHELMHFWWALVLLGIGWNFLFVGGTTLLPQAYNHSERFAAQAVNDFLVFSTQAIAALTAGWVLFSYGWSTQLLICIPFISLAFLLSGIVIFSKKTINSSTC